jgi:TonB-linked SusC/RagA family outer membrane protein
MKKKLDYFLPISCAGAKKILLIMKLSGLLLLITLLNVSANVFSQETRLSLDLKNVTVKEVFTEIEQQTNFKFLYRNELVNVDQKVTIVAQNETLENILARLFDPNNLAYKVFEENLVVITNKNLLQQKVTGKITDATTGDPLPGVNVVIQGTTIGTTTDIEGNYTIDIPNNEAVLVFSYVGYMSETIPVGSQNTIDVKLVADIKTLDEVVVVGFGTQKKVNLTGAVGTVDAKDLEERPVQNALQALQGIVPGFNIYSKGNGGELNASKTINIRGVGTIGKGSNSDPLILIDGMEGDLTSLNPQDIENISVLKDAAASSIYGSRAPFGVILITTKKGKEGKTQVNYNNSFRWNTPVLLPDMMNSYEFVNYFNDASINGGGGAIFNDARVARVLAYMNGELDPTDVVLAGSGGKWDYDYTNANVDWYSEYYQKWAPSMEHTLSLNGGNDKWNYYVSANYLDQDGLMRYGHDDFNRYAISLKISGQVSKHIVFDYTARFTRNNYSRATYMSDGFYDNIARRARPIRPIYDPNGLLMADVNYIDALENGGRRDQKKDWLIQQARVTMSPMKNWNIIGELNFTTTNDFTHELGLRSYAYYMDGVNKYRATTSIGNDYVYEYSYKSNFYNPNIYSDFSKSFNKHNFKLMVGFQSELFKYNDMSISRNDLISTNIDVINQTTSTSPELKGQYQNWATVGFFGRLNYDFNGKYLLEANIRYDGTSRYRENLRWNWFPSFSAGWNIAKEGFWEPLADKIGNFKLRASYGELGNQNTSSWYPTYQEIPTATSMGKWIVGGVRPNTANAPGLISASLKWETIRTLNFGVDIGALRNRVTLAFDLFRRYTDDMIGPAPTLPATLGTKVPDMNNTNLLTSGFELSLGWRDKIKDFSYGVRISLADSKTKITKYWNETNKIDKINKYDSYLQGYYMNEIWGYSTIGIAKSNEEMNTHLATLPNGGQNALGSNWAAGDIMYEDLNGDGKISEGARTTKDPGDLRIIGNSSPRYSFGFDLDASWKGFDFRMFWQGILKRDYYETGLTFWGTTSSGQWWSTAFTEHLDYFRPEGHVLGANLDSYYPRPVFGDKNQKPQTQYLQNASYARLKNLQIGYTLPVSVSNKLKLQKIRVYISGENLITITKLAKSLDPESIGIGRQGGTVYPLSKVLSAGLSINF